MKAKVVSTLSALALLLCLPLGAQEVPAGEQAPEQTVVEDPAQEAQPAESQPAQEAGGANAPAGELEGEGAAGEPLEKPAAAESPEQATAKSSESGAGAGSVERMPKTASPLALVALAGAASLAGGLGLRRYRRW